ncbi:unnamed protein product [Polarella glacialis]|uniref:AB hydrolase-1 domain-containing protein n=1 Tax=Polarella glacialis TaxID=89957 RepID=A0A813KUV0_POLGL|nr:unnamed protein product [Polarella glacialis]
MGQSCCPHRGPNPPLPRTLAAEEKLLAVLPDPGVVLYKDTVIVLPGGALATIHSVEVPQSETEEPPFVFIPGYGTGAAIFSLAWHELLSRMTADGSFKPRRLIAVDPLGWNLSSHPRWTAGLDPDKAEEWFVESLEGWRSASGIERMDLVGHSIAGGYLAASYAERHSNRGKVEQVEQPPLNRQVGGRK